MENLNTDQVRIGKRFVGAATPGRKLAKGVVGDSHSDLQKELEAEKRRNLVTRSLIDATTTKINQRTGRKEKHRIARLTSQIEAAKEALASAQKELDNERAFDVLLSTPKSPQTLALESEIAQRTERVVALHRIAQNIDEAQEVKILKERQQSLIQIKETELEQLARKQQRYLEIVDELTEQSERHKEWDVNAALSLLKTDAPVRRRLQCLMRRYCALNSMIEQLTEGKSAEEMAENSNMKMRNRLRAKLAEIQAYCK